jgi:hypothetical protein
VPKAPSAVDVAVPVEAAVKARASELTAVEVDVGVPLDRARGM